MSFSISNKVLFFVMLLLVAALVMFSLAVWEMMPYYQQYQDCQNFCTLKICGLLYG